MPAALRGPGRCGDTGGASGGSGTGMGGREMAAGPRHPLEGRQQAGQEGTGGGRVAPGASPVPGGWHTAAGQPWASTTGGSRRRSAATWGRATAPAPPQGCHGLVLPRGPPPATGCGFGVPGGVWKGQGRRWRRCKAPAQRPSLARFVALLLQGPAPLPKPGGEPQPPRVGPQGRRPRRPAGTCCSGTGIPVVRKGLGQTLGQP